MQTFKSSFLFLFIYYLFNCIHCEEVHTIEQTPKQEIELQENKISEESSPLLNDETFSILDDNHPLKVRCKDLINNKVKGITPEFQKAFKIKTKNILNEIGTELKSKQNVIKDKIKVFLNNSNKELDEDIRNLISNNIKNILESINNLDDSDVELFEIEENDESKELKQKINKELTILLNTLQKISNLSIEENIENPKEDIKKVIESETAEPNIEDVDEYLKNKRGLLYVNIKREVTSTLEVILDYIKEEAGVAQEEFIERFTDPKKSFVAKLISSFDNTVCQLKGLVDVYSHNKLTGVEKLIREEMNTFESFANEKLEVLNEECKKLLSNN